MTRDRGGAHALGLSQPQRPGRGRNIDSGGAAGRVSDHSGWHASVDSVVAAACGHPGRAVGPGARARAAWPRAGPFSIPARPGGPQAGGRTQAESELSSAPPAGGPRATAGPRAPGRADTGNCHGHGIMSQCH